MTTFILITVLLGSLAIAELAALTLINKQLDAELAELRSVKLREIMI